eukprot:TRINITY_DN1421_c0_g1_i2.p1 TRINITY_DN1421_c0_g1~~TRINITY_DN1421_c0_g1_i2.p1  ORF type:complete len:259 (-),score=113.97 TRINITY_DN1421_c0_g1_i2:117-839(-)
MNTDHNFKQIIANPDFDKMKVTREGYYDNMKVMPGFEGSNRLLRATFEAKLAPGSRILIVGAGGGREIGILGESPHAFQFVGVDPSVNMLAMAQEIIDERGFTDRVRLHHGKIDVLPVEEEKYDGAILAFVMHFVPDQEGEGGKLALLNDIRARLKDGAPLYVSDISFDQEEFEGMKSTFVVQTALIGMEVSAAERLVTSVFPNLPIISPARFRELAVSSGFPSVIPLYRALWYTSWIVQ